MRAALLAVLLVLIPLLSADAGTSRGAARGRAGGLGEMSVAILVCDDCYRAFHKPYGVNADNVILPAIESLADGGITFDHFFTYQQCSPTHGVVSSGREFFNNGQLAVPSTWDASNQSIPSLLRAQFPDMFVFGAGKTGSMGFGDITAWAGQRWIGRNGLFVIYENSSGMDYDEATGEGTINWPAGQHASQGTLDDFKTLVDEWRSGYFGERALFWVSTNAIHFGTGATFADPASGAPWDQCDIDTDPEFCDVEQKRMMDRYPLGADWVYGSALDYLTPFERRNLCIFYFADNGGEGGVFPATDTPSTARGKGSISGGGSHTGGVVSGACVPPSNHGTHALAGVSVTDLLPTIADVMGASTASYAAMDGVSFASLLSADCGAGACDTPVKSYLYTAGNAATLRIMEADGEYSMIVALDGSTSELYHYGMQNTPFTDEWEATDLCSGDCGATTTLTVGEETACQGLINQALADGAVSAGFNCNGGGGAAFTCDDYTVGVSTVASGATVRFCEDWNAITFADTGDPQAAHQGSPRGTSGYLNTKYPGQTGSVYGWLPGEPASPTLGSSCTSGCAIPLWVPGNPYQCPTDNTAQGSFPSAPAKDPSVPGFCPVGIFTSTSQYAELNANITGPGPPPGGGTQWMAEFAWKNGNGESRATEGFWGTVSLGANYREVGFTKVIANASNIDEANVWQQPWKDGQWCADAGCDAGGNTSNWITFNQVSGGPSFNNHQLFPFNGTLFTVHCGNALATATQVHGQFSCGTVPGENFALYTAPVLGTGANQFTRDTHYPDGTWGCVRAHWQTRFDSGAGADRTDFWVSITTATSGGERRIIEITGLDTSQLYYSGEWDTILRDSYANKNSNGGGVSETTARFRSRELWVTDGDPATCPEVLFTL